MSFVCCFQERLEVLLANVDACLGKFLQMIGRKCDFSMREGRQGFCWADFNLKHPRQKWKLILLRELTAIYCTLQTLPGGLLLNLYSAMFILDSHSRKERSRDI